ncbi:MAG TPA: long-chain fatty acid--CoA ligase [Blastocatellia bacterium]|nr:long-chain fatty acid--CoA ligase [Blastocatellia bacterium]
MYVRDWMARRAVVSPDKVAIINAGTDTTLNYRQLNERATRLANYLRERCGVQSGDRIAVLALNRAEVLEAFFAAAKLTAILVPLNYRLTQPELEYILRDCEPRALFYEAEFAPVVSRLREQVTISHGIAFDSSSTDPCYEQALHESSTAPVEVESFDAEMPALIIYTSGTTGHPKGALLSHRMLTWNSINTNLGWDLAASDITTVHAPLFHTGGFNVLTLPLLHVGGTVVMLRCFDGTQVLEAIERYRCTVAFGVPTMFQMMMESPRFPGTDLSSLRFLISGGAPCPLPLIEAYQQRGVCFTQGFGMTEVGPNCFKLDLRDARRKAGSIGFPTFHSEARIVDECGHDVPRGEIGELILKGLHVCSGYWRNSEATAAALRGGWFYTGDLARQDDDGYYYIAGRAKDMIISGGENIYPAEVEAVLHAHPSVASAAVFGLPDPKWGETPVAAVIRRGEVTDDEITAFCLDRLARYKIPRRIVFVEEFPLSASGKILKRMLKETLMVDE